MEFPVAYFEGNLIFTPDRKCWAAYEANGFQYDFKSMSTKKSYFQQLLGFFWHLEKPTRLLMLPEVSKFVDRFERLKARVTGPFVPYALSHADMTRQLLEEGLGEEGTKYKLFVMINIDDEVTLLSQVKGLKQGINNFLKDFRDPLNKAERMLGISGLEITESDMREYMATEERIHHRLSESLALTKIKERTTEWIIRRNFWKGIGMPPQRYLWQEEDEEVRYAPVEGALAVSTGRAAKDVGVNVRGKKVIRPRLAEFMSLTEGKVDLQRNRRAVKISQQVGGEEVSGYSSYLTVSELPDQFYIPGHEYLYKLNDLDFPVAVSIYLDPKTNDEVRQKVNLKKMDIDDQSQHTASAGSDLPLSLLQARNEALMLEKDLDDNKFPMFDTSFVFEVVSPNEEELLLRTDALKDFYKSMHMHLVNPAGEQWQLFNEFMPAGPRLCSPDYVHRISPHALAASMIAATKRLGDDSAFFIGTTGILNNPVFFDPSEAPRKNKSGSGAFIGSLGGGKSFTANFICYLLTIYGAKTLIFDPKGDRGAWKEHLIELGDELDIVTLDDREDDYGKLDPWGFLDASAAARTAINIFAFIGRVNPRDKAYTAMAKAVMYVKTLQQKDRSMLACIQALKRNPDQAAKDFADMLETIATLPYAKLMFYDGKPRSISLERRMTVLQIANLDLPDIGTASEDMDASQILSIAFMFSITSFATRFCEDNKEEFTVVVMDEFWALSGTKEGRRLVTRLIRTGRYFYAAVFIISQNAEDLLDERIKNNIGFKFAFRSSDPDEIRKTLKFFDLEPTEDNIAMIKNIQNGKPLFQDLDGHCGIVDIEPFFPHIKEAFDTTPGRKKVAEAS